MTGKPQEIHSFAAFCLGLFRGDMPEQKRAARCGNTCTALNIKPEKEAPMSLTPDRRIPSAAQSKIPTYQISEAEVDESFEAFAALRRLAQSEPTLVENRYFTALQDTAYARFLLNFEAL